MHWHPQVLWVGIGCKQGTSQQLIETAIQQVCRENQLAEGAIAGIATIDLKAAEIGLVELCRDRNWPLRTFSADVLRFTSVPNPSAVVEAGVATPSVAEASALCAASVGGMPSSVYKSPLLVSKQIFRLKGQPGLVTVAIAQTEPEYCPLAASRIDLFNDSDE